MKNPFQCFYPGHGIVGNRAPSIEFGIEVWKQCTVDRHGIPFCEFVRPSHVPVRTFVFNCCGLDRCNLGALNHPIQEREREMRL